MEPALTLSVKELVYRLAQEALFNLVTHAHVVDLRLDQTAHSLVLTVRGFFPGRVGCASCANAACQRVASCG